MSAQERREQVANKEVDRRMRLILRPEKYAAWREKEDARLRERERG